MDILRGVFPASTGSVEVDDISIDSVLEGLCVLLYPVSTLFEVITMSLSDGLGRVVGLAMVIVDEYALELLSFDGVPTVLGSCVSAGSLTQEGTVEPSITDGLCVTRTGIKWCQYYYETFSNRNQRKL